MSEHFLFKPGIWLGAGSVTFSISPELLYFRTRWEITSQDDNTLQCNQRVEIVGGDQMVNVFIVTPKNSESFDITLHNELLGVFSGTGVIEEGLVGWEFRAKGELEGYEVFEKTSSDEYSMHAEYISSDGARTTIRGKIWKSSNTEGIDS